MIVLQAKFVDQLLSKKILLGSGATSNVYKVNNLLTKKGFQCLKVLKSDVFRKIDDPNTKRIKQKQILTEEEDFSEEDLHEKENQIDFEQVKQIYFEYELLNSLDHPNIVKVYGFFFGDETHNPCILLEYCKSNLEKVIKELDDIYLISITYEICSAMKYVHELKIIHRDLKMKNILITLSKHARICDFGISKIMDLTTLTSLTHGVGTLLFMAPEIFNEEENYNEKVDIYSFGVIMYFILTKGEYPKFSGPGSYEKLKFPKNINKLSQSIISKCWSSSPNKRPSFSDILKMIVQNNFLLIDSAKNKVQEIKNHLQLK